MLSGKTTEEMIKDLAALLPAQGPISAFAFLNPLQAMEDHPFIDAMMKVKELFGCEPFLRVEAYRDQLASGRISGSDIREILSEELGASGSDQVAGMVARIELRLSMLEHCINPGTENELRWVLSQTNALSDFHPAASHAIREEMVASTRSWAQEFSDKGTHDLSSRWTWLVQRTVSDLVATKASRRDQHWTSSCLRLVWEIARMRMCEASPLAAADAPVRHRDLLVGLSMTDSDEMVHEVLIPFTAAFLDQGYAHWRLPQRDAGFYRAFLELMSQGGHFSRRWLQPVRDEAKRLLERTQSANETIEESLEVLGIGDEEKERFLLKTMLSLRGFAGMIWQTESRPDRVYIASKPGTLLDFLAVQLLLERFALKSISSHVDGHIGSLGELRASLRKQFLQRQVRLTDEQRAFPIFHLAQIHGWSPRALSELSHEQWKELTDEIDAFSDFERRRVFHFAYERRLQRTMLDAVSARASEPLVRPLRPKLQVITCIDAREESYRRHLEEIEPDVETYAHAGFFCVPMYYRGAGEAHFATLCPVVMKPQHWIVEEVVHSLEESERQRAIARRWLGTATHGFNTGTRGSMMGALLTGLLGPLFTAPLVGRILFPRLTAKIHRTARGLTAPPPITRLRLEREDGATPGPDDEGVGFTLSEMVAMGQKLLQDIGLTDRFAPLVTFLGHGSNCLNNPHESAYHCGACSGGIGSPNARALAAILNDRRVRAHLKSRGLSIPDETHFLGGRHNTATEEVTFYDLELLPTSHIRVFKEAIKTFSKVAARNAHERSRRFETAPLNMTPEVALRHVADRAEDLSQTRPEYGNCTNAMCFVGRRARLRGLYLDRRSFLMSYDQAQDNANNDLLQRILGPVIPVCEAINLLYTFSAIDNWGWGSGTKLPHNITSLLGVMNGASSDLKPGLPWQGCDIHEPVRITFVIESSPEALLHVMSQNAVVDRICRNGWAHVAVLDYETNRIQQFVHGEFVDYRPSSVPVPVIPSSIQWYQGHREHLPFAIIRDH